MSPDQRDAPDSTPELRAFEALPAIVWSFAGPGHVVVAANRAARASRGGRADLIGRTAGEVFGDAGGKDLLDLLDQVYRTGEPGAAGQRRFVVATEPDGTGHEADFTVTALPMPASAAADRGVLLHATAPQRPMSPPEPEPVSAVHEREVALVLQRSLLPQALPVLPWLRSAACYLAADGALAGGDWFDASVLPGGELIASVGDVVGHGAAATAAMGQLRSALGAAVLAGAGPEQAFGHLDRFAASVDATGSTACLIELRPNEQVCWLSAGHPAPVLAGNGDVRLLDLAPGPPLGINGGHRMVHETRLRPGQVLVLYTDGALGWSMSPAASRQRLVAAVAEALRTERDADGICARLIAEVSAGGPPADDVALLVLQRPAEPATPFAIELPAAAVRLAALRRELGDWMDGIAVPADDAMLVQLAVGEAAANAIEHAYLDQPPGTVRVDGHLGGDGVLQLTVTDSGRWRPPPTEPGGRGRGLFLIRETMDSVRLRNGDHGTAVTVRRRLRQPTVNGHADPTPMPAAAERTGSWRLDTTGPGVMATVTGSIDSSNATRIGRDLRVASRGGALLTTVDLTGVALLASAAVRQLFELARQCRDGGSPLRVLVAPGSVAELVLGLTDFASTGEVLHSRSSIQPDGDAG